MPGNRPVGRTASENSVRRRYFNAKYANNRASTGRTNDRRVRTKRSGGRWTELIPELRLHVSTRRRRCNEFCQFTEQTRLVASSQPGPKKGSRCSRSEAKYSTVTQLFRNVYSRHQHVCILHSSTKMETKGQIRLMSAIPCAA